jgi:hypothetical protein
MLKGTLDRINLDICDFYFRNEDNYLPDSHLITSIIDGIVFYFLISINNTDYSFLQMTSTNLGIPKDIDKVIN